MQLNPARGRKHKQLALLRCRIHQTVYAAQPREGTETRRSRCLLVTRCRSGFMQLNPARGRKLLTIPRPMRISMIAVYAAQPREGTETSYQMSSPLSYMSVVYAAQPREGTETHVASHEPWLPALVYAAQPREGTETPGRLDFPCKLFLRFMQLNPARGRKLVYRSLSI